MMFKCMYSTIHLCNKSLSFVPWFYSYFSWKEGSNSFKIWCSRSTISWVQAPDDNPQTILCSKLCKKYCLAKHSTNDTFWSVISVGGLHWGFTLLTVCHVGGTFNTHWTVLRVDYSPANCSMMGTKGCALVGGHCGSYSVIWGDGCYKTPINESILGLS